MFPEENDGFLPFNAVDNNFYLSDWILPEINNVPVEDLAQSTIASLIQKTAKFTGLLASRDISGKIHSIGTAVLIAENKAITASHCCAINIIGQLVLLLEGECFSVEHIENDPHGLDLALVTLADKPGLKYCYALLAKEDQQPRGRYLSIHYAYGKNQLVSTGNIVGVEGSAYMSEHNIEISAGDGASGAGIFNHEGELSSILIYRTNELNKITRKIIPITNTPLLHKDATLDIYPESHLRPYTNEYQQRLMFFAMQGETGSIPMENISYERIRNERQLQDINAFLNSLSYGLRQRNSLNSLEPPALLQRKTVLEGHQSQHQIRSRGRSNKSIFFEEISQNDHILNALAICSHTIAHHHYFRSQLGNQKYIVDYSFDIGISNRKPVSAVYLVIKEFTDNNFHIYPVDPKSKPGCVIIHWPTFKNEIESEIQNRIQHQFG